MKAPKEPAKNYDNGYVVKTVVTYDKQFKRWFLKK